jgi:hypothetical protein
LIEEKVEPQIIYICSAGHSGSTLLDLLLGSHSQIFSLGEIGQFSRFFRDNESCTCGIPVRQCEFWKKARRKLFLSLGQDLFSPPQDYIVSFLPGHKKLQRQPSWIQRQFYRKSLAAISLLGSSLIFHAGVKFAPSVSKGLAYNIALFNAVIQSSHAKYLVDSSKSWFRMKLLYLWKPESIKTIHLVRDGRGVVYSHIRKEGISAEHAAQRWVRTQKSNLWMLRSIPQDHWRLLRYENITKNPQSELSGLCDWLGISYEPAMINFRSIVHHNLAGNRMRLGGEDKIVNLERWRTGLTAHDLNTFRQIAGKLNKFYGYED